MALKEYEYLGEPRQGALIERISSLREHILRGREERRIPEEKRRRSCAESARSRARQELRRACLDAPGQPNLSPEEAELIRKDLHDLFVAVQSYCYPGNYVRDCPTLERVAETLTKFEEDFLGVYLAHPQGPRRAVIRFGSPINVRERIDAVAKPRLAVAGLTSELENWHSGTAGRDRAGASARPRRTTLPPVRRRPVSV